MILNNIIFFKILSSIKAFNYKFRLEPSSLRERAHVNLIANIDRPRIKILKEKAEGSKSKFEGPKPRATTIKKASESINKVTIYDNLLSYDNKKK